MKVDENDYERGNETTQQNKISDSEKFKGWGYRHQQCLILFLCLTTAYTMRACMGVALVAMVDSNSHPITKTSISLANSLKLHISNNGTANDNSGLFYSLLFVPPYPLFKWTKKIQDSILSSFFLGYMLLQIPGGQMAHFFGARYLLAGALLINCVISICLPWAALYGGWILICIFRFIQGLSQACIIPSMHTAFGKWTTLEERGRLAGLAYGGQAFGTVLGLLLTGFIASSYLGWPGIFRFYGILSGIMGGVIWAFVADSPAQHPKISTAERLYIESSFGSSEYNGMKKLKVPWKSILKCRGMYAIIFAHVGNAWGTLTLYSEVPAFMDKIMGVNIKANGLLTALPFLVMGFTNFFFSWFSDMLIVKKILSIRHTRKLMNSLGSFPSAIGLIVLAYVPKNIYVVESLLVIICAFKTATHTGFHLNHIDISSNFSGTMISISNFVSHIFGCLAPLMAGFILTDVTSEYLWRKVFFVTAGFYIFTNAAYVILGTAETAEWDKPVKEKPVDLKEIEPMLTEKADLEKSNGLKK